MKKQLFRWPGSSMRRLSLTVLLVLASSVLAVVFQASPSSSAPLVIPDGFSDELLHVKFVEGTNVDSPDELLPPELAESVQRIDRLFSLSPSELAELRKDPGLPDLNLWLRVLLEPDVDAALFVSELVALPSVELAEPAPLPTPSPAVTPDFTGSQGYLGAAPDGIGAEFAWTIPGGTASGITIYDIEYEWNQNHEDLSKAAGVTLLLGAGDVSDPPFANNSHGTAVLGELVGDDNDIGVTGIAKDADIGLAPSRTVDLGLNVANAILLAAADGKPGDVILLEAQANVCGLADGNYGPVEWSQAVFDAIQTAVANRIVVVEAAGNGGVDLDQASCDSRFDRTMRDSGAIIVGAGASPVTGPDRERLGFSSYGTRVDLQGWGQDVVTTGYGTADPDGYRDPDDPTNPNSWYRFTFGGTSSASPMVAGSAASLQGIAIDRFGTPLVPFQLRELLRETGSPQQGDTSEHIGPRPDIEAAFNAMTSGPVDLFIVVDLSGSFADDLPNFKAQAPGIISSLIAANPDTRFGLARFEDYPIPPFGNAAAGDTAYERLVDLTFDTDLVLNSIAGLSTRNGGDSPESQLTALFQAATGAGQDLSAEGFPGASIPAGQQANFRDDVTKLFLLWTDASFHLPEDPGDIPYPGPTFVETVEAILALDPPMVIGVSSGAAAVPDLEELAVATRAVAPPEGVDCDANGSIDIPGGEALVCPIALNGAGIGDAIVAVVEAAKEIGSECLGAAPTIIGTDGPDRLVGTDGPDVIVGGGGNDFIRGLGGDDIICAGDGNDRVLGGHGNDTILGEAGDDDIHGQLGDDRIDGGQDDDRLFGDLGDDELEGGAGEDLIFAGTGADIVSGGPDDDRLYGGSGVDDMRGGSGDDTIVGGNGDDSLRGEAGDDTVQGSAGDDYLSGGDDEDRCNGNLGPDSQDGTCEVAISIRSIVPPPPAAATAAGRSGTASDSSAPAVENPPNAPTGPPTEP